MRRPGLPGRPDRPAPVLHQSMARLGTRIVELVKVVGQLESEIAEIVEDLAPGVVAAEPGLGALSLAQVLLSWSHAGRIHSQAALAVLSGTAPIPVSSGRTDRHRLNRLGDRQLNRALHIVAVTTMRSHPPTLAYVERRRPEGRTDNEIRRNSWCFTPRMAPARRFLAAAVGPMSRVPVGLCVRRGRGRRHPGVKHQVRRG